ncbi:MAG: ribosome biogenesis GTPase Der [Leptotrichiaceae bacterium]|jgi:GTP-binding protein|nr:ribosome biogenesis GTPase Der [Leptotrichiaceae bacterium]MBP6167489.1 ribosome biogenesis GTPase Der [Leptotrichiaceae bacterium]MBP7026080.1 ribosome biogenesis GTPase Der [Leptotrichiaceae bacterium]MBP8636606.1 ribosome biogenesis GTPase Der [Leptotrichiaceae bacterium]MBP9538405.1 ribosome biogenesis GTPase Der [Leptotrichiaceae bacterium]
MKPVVAIVGRPNVGKSTLFNKLIGQRLSIVKDEPGVTRDRLYRQTEWSGKEFILIDTGGLEPKTNDFMLSQIKQQAQVAIDEADVILFLVDGRAGITALDEDVATILRKRDKKVVVAVNKIDNYIKDQDKILEFYSLGFEDVIGMSAEHKTNLGDLLDAIVDKFPNKKNKEVAEGLSIAVLGRPNAGKSSLVNKLLNEERTIVSEIAGTTRDAIDSDLNYKGERYTLIDTAGIRRKAKVDDDVEYYSILRAIKSIQRANVCILMLDATELLTDQDKRVAGLIFDEKKPIIIAINKWDLIEKDNKSVKSFTDLVKADLAFLDYAPIITMSALTGKRTINVLDVAKEINGEYHKKISTGLLNQVLAEMISQNPVPTRKGRAVKINYATQIGVAPPRFVFFSNNPELVHFSYKRYMENKLREYFGYEGCPIEIIINKKNE